MQSLPRREKVMTEYLSCSKCGMDLPPEGRQSQPLYYEGDAYPCPKCKTNYSIGVTDDYEDDARAYLIEERQ